MRKITFPAFFCVLLAPVPAAANGPGEFADPAGLSGFESPPRLARSSDLNRTVRRMPGVGATATALANSVNVRQSGHGNTVILNLEQVNTGSVAAGGALNGSLDLD